MSITLEQVTKRYQGQPVVNDVSLEVAEGEFFVLLGPSGSGKSTLLRAIAGLVDIQNGSIALHGTDVTHVGVRERGVGFVFQNYALFRHLSIADNIEFALRVRRMKAADRRARRKELLKLVALEGMDDRLCPRSSPAASSSAWPWRARWRTSRRCCCWMNPSVRSTRRSARNCAAPSAWCSGSLA